MVKGGLYSHILAVHVYEINNNKNGKVITC